MPVDGDLRLASARKSSTRCRTDSRYTCVRPPSRPPTRRGASIRIVMGISLLVSKLLCRTLDKRSNICSNERAGFNNVVFRSFSGGRKYGQARGRGVEFELELAALLSKLPLEGHDLVGAVSALGRSRKCVYLLECGHAYG